MLPSDWAREASCALALPTGAYGEKTSVLKYTTPAELNVRLRERDPRRTLLFHDQRYAREVPRYQIASSGFIHGPCRSPGTA